MARTLSTKVITINNDDYIAEEWNTRTTYQNLFEIGKLAAPFSSAMTSVMQGGDDLKEVIPGSILFMCEQLGGDGFDKFFKMMTKQVTGKNGVGQLDLDDLTPDEALIILTKLMEFYYKPFFEKALTQVKGFMTEILKVSNLNQTLNKPSKD